MIHSQSAACAALRRWIIMKIWFIPGLVKMWFRPPPLAQSSSRRPSREQDFYCHFDLREEGSEKNYDNIYSGRAGLTDLSPFRYRRLCLSRSSPCRFIPAVSPFQINPVRTWLTDISSFQPRGIELWQLWMPIVHQKWDRGPSEEQGYGRIYCENVWMQFKSAVLDEKRSSAAILSSGAVGLKTTINIHILCSRTFYFMETVGHIFKYNLSHN